MSRGAGIEGDKRKRVGQDKTDCLNGDGIKGRGLTGGVGITGRVSPISRYDGELLWQRVDSFAVKTAQTWRHQSSTACRQLQAQGIERKTGGVVIVTDEVSDGALVLSGGGGGDNGG